MSIITDFGHGIYMLDALYVKPDIASIYLIQQKDSVVIVETGTSHSVERIKAALDEIGLKFKDVSYIIPTHVHLDHAGGAGELMRLCKNANLIIHPKGARHMVDPNKLIAGTIEVYGEQKFKLLYGRVVPIEKHRVIEAADSFILNINGRILKFLDTPGHARHHFCVWDEESKTMFTGDTFGVSYREFDTKDNILVFPTTTPVQFEPDKLLSSIDLIMSYKPDNIALTHFSMIKPEKKVVKQLKDGVMHMSSIAKEQFGQADSKEKIKQKISSYLLGQLDAGKDKNFCLEKLENDLELNAQGLMVWMAHQQGSH